MDEQRIAAYRQLIQKLLECSSGEEPQTLNLPSRLIDPGLLQMIITIAQEFDDNGNQNKADFLTNLAFQLGEWLGNDQQSTAIRKPTADILLQWGIEQAEISHFLVACQCWQQCLIIYKAIGDRQGEAISLGNLGNAYYSLGEFKRAIAYHGESLAIQREIKNSKGEAIVLVNLGNAYDSLGQFEQAIIYYKQSLVICEEIADRQGKANALGSLGHAYHSLGEYKKAIDSHEQSLAIFLEIEDRQGQATSLANLGIVYDSLGEYKQAMAYHQKSLAMCQQIQHQQGESNSLANLGIVYDSLGEYKQAIAFQEQSLAISRKIKDRRGEAISLGNLGNVCHSMGQEEAVSLGNLGNVYHPLGQFEQAIVCHEQSLEIKQEIEDRLGEANSLGNLANVYHSVGQFEQAINYEKQSLDICQEIKHWLGEAACLAGLGNGYNSLGKYKRAIDFYEQSLAICREIKHRLGQATVLGNLGNAYLSLREYELAITYHTKSLDIYREIKDRQGEAVSLGNIGNAYLSLREYELAITYHEQSLVICHKIKYQQGEAAFLNSIAIAYRELQQTEVAIEKFRDCLKIATPTTMPAECFKGGQNLGDISFTQGGWHLALEGYEPAIKAVEQLRKGSTTDDRRQKIIAEAISVYANAVQCYINLKQYDKAVETADRSRSRHLADLFASKDLYPQGEITPEVEAYYRLQQQSDRLLISENDGTKAIATTGEPIPNGEAISKKIKELEEEKQKAWLKIRSKDQVLAAQLQPAPLSFDQMQALIPDAETAILNFYTTDEHTHIFILRQNQSTQLHTCEGQGYETLQNWLFKNWLKPYKENQTAWQNQMGEVLHELANRLQINRLIPQHLNGIQELIIIPHLYLHQIPFAALPLNEIPIPQSDTASDRTRALKPLSKPTITPAKTPPQKQPEYLSDKFRLRIVPSSQILNFCHQRGNIKPSKMGIVENATGDLVFTGYECETLATMHQIDKNSRLQYQQATISNYEDLLNQVQVLHSSHHASSDLNNSLESKLLLSDGDINLARIFTWRFTDLAEVFLSCCETNLTLTQITDDPLSIASGFLCAGARNVVSTLWAVDDLATALFCILYYQEKQDKSRSEAICQAQFKLRHLTGDELSASYKLQLEDYFEGQPSGEQQAEIVKNVRVRLQSLCRETLPFVSPYYWAGFVSQGLA